MYILCMHTKVRELCSKSTKRVYTPSLQGLASLYFTIHVHTVMYIGINLYRKVQFGCGRLCQTSSWVWQAISCIIFVILYICKIEFYNVAFYSVSGDGV